MMFFFTLLNLIATCSLYFIWQSILIAVFLLLIIIINILIFVLNVTVFPCSGWMFEIAFLIHFMEYNCYKGWCLLAILHISLCSQGKVFHGKHRSKYSFLKIGTAWQLEDLYMMIVNHFSWWVFVCIKYTWYKINSVLIHSLFAG